LFVLMASDNVFSETPRPSESAANDVVKLSDEERSDNIASPQSVRTTQLHDDTNNDRLATKYTLRHPHTLSPRSELRGLEMDRALFLEFFDKYFDESADGDIDLNEFGGGLDKLGLSLPDDERLFLFDVLLQSAGDVDNGQYLGRDEFADFLLRRFEGHSLRTSQDLLLRAMVENGKKESAVHVQWDSVELRMAKTKMLRVIEDMATTEMHSKQRLDIPPRRERGLADHSMCWELEDDVISIGQSADSESMDKVLALQRETARLSAVVDGGKEQIVALKKAHSIDMALLRDRHQKLAEEWERKLADYEEIKGSFDAVWNELKKSRRALAALQLKFDRHFQGETAKSEQMAVERSAVSALNDHEELIPILTATVVAIVVEAAQILIEKKRCDDHQKRIDKMASINCTERAWITFGDECISVHDHHVSAINIYCGYSPQ